MYKLTVTVGALPRDARDFHGAERMAEEALAELGFEPGFVTITEDKETTA